MTSINLQLFINREAATEHSRGRQPTVPEICGDLSREAATGRRASVAASRLRLFG